MPTVSLDIQITPDAEIWEKVNTTSPTLAASFDAHPEIVAYDMTFTPSPQDSVTLIGSPNAWILEDGIILSAENTIPSPGICDILWKIGREMSFMRPDPILFPTNARLFSVLFFPSLICTRDGQDLKSLAKKTWNGDSSKENLKLKGTAPAFGDVMQKRARAQAQNLAEIYASDLGQHVKVGTLSFSSKSHQKDKAKQA